MVKSSVAGGRCRRECVELAVQYLQQSRCVAAVAVGRDAEYDSVEALCCGGGSKHVRSITGSGGFSLEGRL